MSGLSIHLLNVGRGDCILLRFPDKSWAVVDCGERSYPYEPHNQAAIFLKEEQPYDTPVRFILATHPDSDHDGGIMQLLQLINRDVRAVYYSGVERRRMMHCGTLEEDVEEYSFVKEAQRRLARREILEFKALQRGDRINFNDPPLPDVSIKVLWPIRKFVDLARGCHDLGRQHQLRNNVSVVLEIKYAGCSIILPGDIQGEYVNRDVFGSLQGSLLNVIKAPHHGGVSSIIPWDIIGNSDGEKFVLISCPSYSEKHPHRKFLSSIPMGDKRWKIRCTGIASACADRQEPVTWPLPAEDRSFLPVSLLRYESMRRSFLAIGKRGRIVRLHVHHECCLNNQITISEVGKIKHTMDVSACDSRINNTYLCDD